MTTTVRLVLAELLANPNRERYGYQLAAATRLATGTVYPILARLQRAGWVQVRADDIDPHREQRPPRRYVRLTTHGRAHAATALRWPEV
jgi:DNA-binding PadR family transcriptional regulator